VQPPDANAALDPLTGLADRGSIISRLAALEGDVIVIIAGLDRFRALNDGVGHEVGDRVLQETAARLTSVTPGFVGRFGSDEFAIVAVGQRPEEFAATVRDAISAPLTVGPHHLTMTAGLGMAVSHGRSSARHRMLRDADTALAQAKLLGPNSTVLFDDGLRDDVERTLTHERLLRDALANDRLRIAFQPIVDAVSTDIVGVEALVRIETAEGRIVSPGSFIPLAEEIGLITQIDDWMLDACAAWAARWWELFHSEAPYVSCNVSAAMVQRGDLYDRVRDLRREYGLPGYLMCLEITESTLVEMSRAVWEQLAKIRATGVHVGLDDFGTRFSSMSYLRDFPVSFLKIDQSFVESMEQNHRYAEIVDAMVYLGHRMGMKVTAEGVETIEQACQLRALGCERLQGYLFSRPVSGLDLEDALGRQLGLVST
jgi:diguanylate cyclase (GGDEF)-like protein